jgi:hypothetical protein
VRFAGARLPQKLPHFADLSFQPLHPLGQVVVLILHLLQFTTRILKCRALRLFHGRHALEKTVQQIEAVGVLLQHLQALIEELVKLVRVRKIAGLLLLGSIRHEKIHGLILLA